MANRTITTLYDNYDDAAQAVRDLETAGIPPRDISLVANDLEGREKKVATTEAGAAGITWGGITGAAPYPPLPKDFKGPFLELRFGFYYNLDPEKFR